jgi:hypothetical protein
MENEWCSGAGEWNVEAVQINCLNGKKVRSSLGGLAVLTPQDPWLSALQSLGVWLCQIMFIENPSGCQSRFCTILLFSAKYLWSLLARFSVVR